MIRAALVVEQESWAGIRRDENVQKAVVIDIGVSRAPRHSRRGKKPAPSASVTIQLILQFKIFDQVYLFTQGGYRVDTTMVMVQYIFRQAFQLNKGGLAAAASVVLFLLIIVMSVLQYQLLRARGQR